MLTSELMEELVTLCKSEDENIWKIGDLLRDNSLTKSETKKVAEVVQRKPSTLELRRRVSTETPEDKRKPQYSWSIYREFVRIEEPVTRWEIMFGRPEWTLEQAREVVSRQLSGPEVADESRKALVKTMWIDDTLIRAKLEKDKGLLTIKVVGMNETYRADYDQDHKNTTFTLVAA